MNGDLIDLKNEKSQFNFHNEESRDSIDKLNDQLNKKNVFDDYFPGNTANKIHSGIQFSKNNLFFKSTPNKIAFDSVKVKNTGTTCIYFKWQRVYTPCTLEARKNDGIEKFFCHYSDSKLSPNEEKEFTLSFFSEKNGNFFEDWILVTNPQIKNVNLNLHLNGMCLLIEDAYSNKVLSINKALEDGAVRSIIKELVTDIISTIKHTDPPLPEMTNKEDFEYFFVTENKKYNVEYSQYNMKLFNDYTNKLFNILAKQRGTGVEDKDYYENEIDNSLINQSINDKLNTEEVKKTATVNTNPNLKTNESNLKIVNNKAKVDESSKNKKVIADVNEPVNSQAQPKDAITKNKQQLIQEKFNKQNPDLIWTGNIEHLFDAINLIDDESIKELLDYQLKCLIHVCRSSEPENNILFSFSKNLFNELALEFVDENNAIREDMLLHPIIFDYLSRKFITNDKDMDKYNLEVKKRIEEYYKKAKKKPYKNKEEEEAELKLYKSKSYEKMVSLIHSKIDNLSKAAVKKKIDNLALKGNKFNESYIEFLSKIMTISTLTKTIKDAGISLVRIDLNGLNIVENDTELNISNVDGLHKNIRIKKIEGLDKCLKSVESLFNKNAKLVVLLIDWGPKNGFYNEKYSTKQIADYLSQEGLLEQIIEFEPNINNFKTFNKRLSEDVLKENTLLIVENLNFFPEECGYEFFEQIKPVDQNRSVLNASNNNIENEDSRISNSKNNDKITKDLKDAVHNKGSSSFKDVKDNKNKNKVSNLASNVVNVSMNNESGIENEEPKLIKTSLNYYTKKKFISKLSQNIDLYVNDSIYSIKNKYPTILDFNLNVEKRVLGTRIEEQLNKITTFFSIDSKDYLLVVGSNLQENPDSDLFNILLTVNATLPKFRTIVFLGKVGLMIAGFIQKNVGFGKEFILPQEYYSLVRYIIISAKMHNVNLILPCDIRTIPLTEYKRFNGQDFSYYNDLAIKLEKVASGELEQNPNDIDIRSYKIDNSFDDNIGDDFKNPFGKNINYFKYYFDVINKLRKRQKREEKIIESTDADELEDHEEYHIIKLTKEEKETLKKYENNSVSFSISNAIRDFYNLQKIDMPKKMLKNQKQEFDYQDYIYNKKIVLPQNPESKIKKEDLILNDLDKDKNKDNNPLAVNRTSVLNVNNLKDAKDKVKDKDKEKDNKDAKDVKDKDKEKDNKQNLVNSGIKENVNSLSDSTTIVSEPKLAYSTESSLIDYGEETYKTLYDNIKRNNCVMVLGELHPTKISNLFDDYLNFTKCIVDSKAAYKKVYEDMVLEDPNMKNLEIMKQKKFLMNIFLKSPNLVEMVKQCKKRMAMLVDQEDDADDQVDEEQLNLDMVYLVDYIIEDNLEIIDNVLQGEDIPGFYALSENKEIGQKTEELDLKYLDEI